MSRAAEHPSAGRRQASARPIPYDEIGRFPLPGTAVPMQTAFGPGDRVLTYVHSPEATLERRLFVVDLDPERTPAPVPVEVPVGGAIQSEEELSVEERLARERRREVGLGVTTATWAADADVLVVPLPDGIRVLSGLADDPDAPRISLPVRSGDGEAPVVGATPSPDGSQVAFVQGGELLTVPVDGASPPLRLTTSAVDGVTNGLAEFVAEEEMDRREGLWWSPDSRLVAYAEVDARHIPVYRIVHQGSDTVGPSAEEDHRYPFAGMANARVRLGVVPAVGGETTWMETGEAEYIARVHWTARAGLVVELQSRDQRVLEVVSLDPSSGAGTVLHREECEPFVNLHDDYRLLASGEWLWSSERTGFRHLEVRSSSGELVRVLTDGEWQVDQLEAVDEERALVYFTASKDGPTERHLYAVSLAGGEIRRVTAEPGTHLVTVARSGSVFVDQHASLDRPPAVVVRSLTDETGAGAALAVLHDRRDPRIDVLALEPPELFSFETDDGAVLHGLCYRPTRSGETGDGVAEDNLAPLVVRVYGGPRAQLVVNDWRATADLRAQALRRLGCCVIVVDNRGSFRRGLRFERPVHRNLGTLEVTDQVEAVREAGRRRYGDPSRVAVYGWSYGGYMTLRCLSLAPDVFRAGVAGAPVTAWDGYDTHYTERYMGTPANNPDGYESSAVFAHVPAMKGRLLLVHGLIDENVHFRHTARLLRRLVEQQKDYQLLLFPSERHLPRKLQDRASMERQVIEFLTGALGLDVG